MSKDKIYATLSEFDPLPVDWFFPKLIPYGMLTVMEGDPGVGKSFIAMQLAATASTGGKLPNGERVEKSGVLYCSTEDDPSYTIRPRIDAMGGDPDRIRIQENYSPFGDEGFALLRREIREHKARFVVMDPFYAYVPSTSDMYKPNEIRPMLAKLSAIGSEVRSGPLTDIGNLICEPPTDHFESIVAKKDFVPERKRWHAENAEFISALRISNEFSTSD
jgi:RecA-family ATPase